MAPEDPATGQIEGELFGLLRGFRVELAAIQVLDAACGSGNFLYVSLRLLLDLEKEVITLRRRGRQPGLPHGLAEAAPRHRDQRLRLRAGADHDLDRLHPMVARQRFRIAGGADPEAAGGIRQMDAILTYGAGTGAGRSEPEWPAADVIVGNPPFLGGERLRTELGDAYVDALFDAVRWPGAV